jgi:hypothetical protein
VRWVSRVVIGPLLAFSLGLVLGGSSNRQSTHSLFDSITHATSYLEHNQARMLRAKSAIGVPFEAYNWGGYADVYAWNSLGTFARVSGTWTIPAVTCPTASTAGVGAQDLIVADWVGMDGFSSGTVEQLGSMSQCFEGVATYFVWWEMYPGGSSQVSFAYPGDVIHASVVRRTSESYQLSLTDSTNPEVSFSTTQSCLVMDLCLNDSAEWIVERPAYQIGVTPEADYGTTTVTHMSATLRHSRYKFATYGIWTVDATDSYALAKVSPLVKGSSYTSTWLNSY